MKVWWLKIVVPILLVLAGVWFYASKSGMFLDQEALIAEASVLAEKGDLEGAEETIQPLLKLWEVPNELWLFVANINRIEGDFASALTYLDEIDESSPEIFQQAQIFRAEALLQLGHLQAAGRQYEAVLAEDPSQSGVRRQWIFLLNVAGLIQESVPQMLTLVQSGQADPELLLLLCDTSTPRRNDALIAKGLESFPEDPFVQMAAGFIDRESNAPEDALQHFKIALQNDPEFTVSWVNALETAVLLEDGQTASELISEEPPRAEKLPEYWQIKGDLCRRAKRFPEAARCYWEAARRAPDHIASHFQLGQMLREMGREEESQLCSQWANELSHLAALSKSINKNTPDIPGITKIANQLLKLQRGDEARAWVALGQRIDPNALSPLRAKLENLPTTNDAEFPQGPVARIDLQKIAPPVWDALLPNLKSSPRPRSTDNVVKVNFEDVSASAGFEFQYQNGGDPNTEGRAIYEYTGGGVGVLDFDMDG